MSDWKITIYRKKRLNKPVLIEGMPGIGSVGKITADMLVERLKAERIASFSSHCLPNSVFVTEDNLVEMPKIELWHAKVKGKDFLFLVGDVQPMKEEDSHRFAEAVLGLAKKLKVREVVALGGIGLQELPESPKVFVTGNNRKMIDDFKKLGADNRLYGVVGPIIGIIGLTLGMGKGYGINAVALLAETYAGPMHIGLRESKGVIRLLEKMYHFGISLSLVEKDIRKYENALKPVQKQQEMQEHESYLQDTSYIG